MQNSEGSMRILVICTGNSCRSQMAEGFLKSFNPDLQVFSAGTLPSPAVHPMAIQVMKEAGIDIGEAETKSVDRFLGQSFDYVITVCDNAKKECPVFPGKVRHRLHIGLEDPSEARGTEEERLRVFRRVRNQIQVRFRDFERKARERKHTSQ